MLAREARVALEAFAQAVLPAEALLVAAVGALGPREGEEYQVAHRRRPAPRRRGGAASAPDAMWPAARLGRAGSSGRATDWTPCERWAPSRRATSPLPPFALDQRPSRNASVLQRMAT